MVPVMITASAASRWNSQWVGGVFLWIMVILCLSSDFRVRMGARAGTVAGREAEGENDSIKVIRVRP